MILAAENVGRVRAQRGSLGDCAQCPVRNSAQRDDALGNLIDISLNFAGNIVKQLVQGDEVRPLDIPVRLLRLQAQVDQIGESLVEQLGDRDALIEFEMVPVTFQSVLSSAKYVIVDPFW